MPTIQGISMCIITSVDEAGQPADTETKVCKFPEYPHTAPQPLQPKTSQRKTSRPLSSLFGGSSKTVEVKRDPPVDPKRQSSVYIPLLPQAASFQISYAFIPDFPEGVRFAYVVLFNGKHVATADVMPQKEPKGYLCQTIGEAYDGVGSNKTFKYEALGFEFAAQKRFIKKSTVEDGGLIEVRWYRIHGSKPVELELAGKLPVQTLKDKYGICFKPTGPPANLKHRVYLLKDPIEQPWAAFRFFYRSWESLREHSIVVEDECSENFRQGAPIGDSTRSLLSYYEDEERSSSLPQAPGTTLNSSPIRWRTSQGSTNVANNYVPIGMAQAAYFGGDATEGNIARAGQGRIVSQSTADEGRRQSLMLEEAPRRSRSTTRRSADTADRKSLVSLTPSLKECVDREDPINDDDLIGIAKTFSATALAVPKVRPGHTSGAHTGISAQMSAMRAHDNVDPDSTVGLSSRKENEKPVAPLCLPSRLTGIYQRDNTGLAHYGESGLSSQSMSYQDTSSVIDGDFAASELAPPTMGDRIADNSRRQSAERFTPRAGTTRVTIQFLPIQTPGGHDFPIISSSLTPKDMSNGIVMESSPTKTPGGGELPVDPPGSAGFPVIEPGESLKLSPGEGCEGCMPGVSSDDGEGSVIHHTPPKAPPESAGFPRRRKPLPPFLSPIRGRGLNSRATSAYRSSSPLEELMQLGLVGVVQRKISEYESPRDSLLVPPTRVVSPYVAGDAAGGEAAHARPGSGLGNLKASASLLALQNRRVGEAKSVIAAAKSKLGLHLEPKRRGGATDGKVSGEKQMAVDDLNDTFIVDDDTFESSSPAKFDRKLSHKSKGKGKKNTTGDDVFCPAGGEATTPRRRPSSEDDIHHPLRRRASLAKATCHDWMSPAHKTSKSTSTLSKGGDVSWFEKLVQAERQDHEIAAMVSFSLSDQIIVESAVVADGVSGVAQHDADSHRKPSPNDYSRAAPAPTADVGFTATTGSSNDYGDASGEVGRPATPLHNYAHRMVGLIPPIETLSGGIDHTTLEDHFFDDDAVDVDLAIFDEMLCENARQRQTAAERHGIFARANLTHVGELVRSAVGGDAAAPSPSVELYNAYALSPPVYRGAQANPIVGSGGQQDGEDGTVPTNVEQNYLQLHVQRIQQAIMDSIARASATSPVAKTSGSVQAAQSSPITPRRQVSAALGFQPRNYSVRYASHPAATATAGLNTTPTRSTLNAVSVPGVGAPTTVGGLAAPVYHGPQGNALRHSSSVLQCPHPFGGSPVTSSPSITFDGRHREVIDVLTPSRTPSVGMEAASLPPHMRRPGSPESPAKEDGEGQEGRKSKGGVGGGGGGGEWADIGEEEAHSSLDDAICALERGDED